MIALERRIAASPATIFAFFADSESWMQWQGVEAAIELRPGGTFRVNVRGDGFASGEFLEVERDRRIVFTWGWERESVGLPPGSSIVEIELEPDGAGTILRLHHRRLPAPALDAHRAGWQHYLERLAAVSEGRDPGPDATIIER